MTRTPAIAVPALALAVALGISSCALLPGAQAELTYEDSPLSAYFNSQGDMSEDEMQAHWAEQQLRVEELVAACMAAEGFEYVPVDHSQNGGVSFSGDEWNPDSREWVEQYGYGAVNYPGRDDRPDPGQEWFDPNQDYVQSLSESEMTAFYETLYGPSPTEEQLDENGGYEYDWANAGCYGSAQHEVQGNDPYSSDEHKPLMDALNEFYMNLQNHASLTELNRAWASCMTAAGYSGFTTQYDAQNSIYDDINAYYESMTGEYVENDPKLLAIGEREIEVALADLDCREETDYRQASLRIQFDLERAFVDEHKPELEALKASLQRAA